jgi:hypothetical protein
VHLNDLILKNWVGWDGLTAVATLALVFVGVATVIYAGVQLADFRQESRIKHLIDLVDQFEREPYAGYRRSLAAHRLKEGSLVPLDLENPPFELYAIMNFFEHMGFLLKGHYLNLEGLAVEFHYWILNIWADARELVKLEQADDPIYYEHFVLMVNQLLEYDRPQTGKLDLPSASDVEDFYSDEAHLSPGSPIPRKRRRKRRRRQGLLRGTTETA